MQHTSRVSFLVALGCTLGFAGVRGKRVDSRAAKVDIKEKGGTSSLLNASAQTKHGLPIQCMHGVHVWVQHGNRCPERYDDSEGDAWEKLGCALPDWQRVEGFVSKTPWDLPPGAGMDQVHWFGGEHRMRGLYYMDSENLETYTEPIKGGATWELNPYNKNKWGVHCSVKYEMPDYCSRAIVSELSWVYGDKYRHSTISSGAKHLLDTKNPSCKTIHISTFGTWDKLYHHILDRSIVRDRACWGFGQEYRKLFCKKYSVCHCETKEECAQPEKIQCCRDQYQQFLDEYKPEVPNGDWRGEWNPYSPEETPMHPYSQY